MTAVTDLSQFERPSVTVDVLVFTIAEGQLKVALIKRGIPPFKNRWAIPGGFVHIDESLEQAAQRELAEEAGVEGVYLEQLYTFGALERDPRGRVITVAYYALVPDVHSSLVASTDASEAQWFAVDALPPLAFDHKEILEMALERLKSKLEYSNIAYSLLSPKFRLTELQQVYEIILGRPLDKRNFRKRMLSLGLLEATSQVDRSGAHRPAQLYRFKKRKMVVFG
jgi:8-oxo-dGTP diphosphatase